VRRLLWRAFPKWRLHSVEIVRVPRPKTVRFPFRRMSCATTPFSFPAAARQPAPRAEFGVVLLCLPAAVRPWAPSVPAAPSSSVITWWRTVVRVAESLCSYQYLFTGFKASTRFFVCALPHARHVDQSGGAVPSDANDPTLTTIFGRTDDTQGRTRTNSPTVRAGAATSLNDLRRGGILSVSRS